MQLTEVSQSNPASKEGEPMSNRNVWTITLLAILVLWILFTFALLSGCTSVDPSLERRVEALEAQPTIQFQWKPDYFEWNTKPEAFEPTERE